MESAAGDACAGRRILERGAIYHSQSGVSTFTQIPGLRVVYASNALDANGLLRTAIRCDDPVLFLEHKHLYRQAYNKSQYPPDDFMIPFGKRRLFVRERFYPSSPMAPWCNVLWSPQSKPNNRASTLRSSICAVSGPTIGSHRPHREKTNRVIVAHEDSLSFGFGAEIVARIATNCLNTSTHRPPCRALDTFVAYAPQLEDVILPQPADVLKAITELHRY